MTTAADLLLAAFLILNPEEQEDAFRRIVKARLERLAGDEGETARFLRSLRRVAEHLGDEELTSTSYRRGWCELRDAGEEEVENLNALIRFFGSWREAREALDLSETSTARKIESRFAERRLGKVWRYTERTLRETLGRCFDDIGFVPQVAEFDHWRQRELELARARGEDAKHIPSAGPYRRRYGSWEKALIALGYTSDAVAERLERGGGSRPSVS